ncbi:MAG: hypothetical protein ACRDCE_01510 [Cetobacterium sp.]|uniref:hypothetical protein n=1 Tax=Cetobacterium sp. TaxID=2071632 RepID=UPI003EE4D7E5
MKQGIAQTKEGITFTYLDKEDGTSPIIWNELGTRIRTLIIDGVEAVMGIKFGVKYAYRLDSVISGDPIRIQAKKTMTISKKALKKEDQALKLQAKIEKLEEKVEEMLPDYDHMMPLPGYDGIYAIDEKGALWSIPRVIIGGGVVGAKLVGGTKRKPSPNKFYVLTVNGVVDNVSITYVKELAKSFYQSEESQ